MSQRGHANRGYVLDHFVSRVDDCYKHSGRQPILPEGLLRRARLAPTFSRRRAAAREPTSHARRSSATPSGRRSACRRRRKRLERYARGARSASSFASARRASHTHERPRRTLPSPRRAAMSSRSRPHASSQWSTMKRPPSAAGACPSRSAVISMCRISSARACVSRARSAASRMARDLLARLVALSSSTRCGIPLPIKALPGRGQPLEQPVGIDLTDHVRVGFLRRDPHQSIVRAADGRFARRLDLDKAVAAGEQLGPQQVGDDAGVVHRMAGHADDRAARPRPVSMPCTRARPACRARRCARSLAAFPMA